VHRAAVDFGALTFTTVALGRDGRGVVVARRLGGRRHVLQTMAVDRRGRPGRRRALEGARNPLNVAVAAAGGGRSVVTAPGTKGRSYGLVAWLLDAGGRARRVALWRSAGRPAVTVDRHGRVLVVLAVFRGGVQARWLSWPRPA
jgi:hypothetical protein